VPDPSFQYAQGATSPVNVPNALSAARIALIPVLLWYLFADPNGSLTAAVLFALASVTDVVDGHLARSRGLVTELGKVLDPLADKLMVVSVLLSLVVLDRVPAWAVAVILGREVVVSVLRSRASRRGGTEVGARPLGKMKMAFQVALGLVLLAAPDANAAAVLTLLYATVSVTVVSGIDNAVHLLRPRRAWPRVR
jgi:CDP-diacylglycerol--glycerol-3-phosphate 3-phosphatidyltransferase